MHAGLGAAYAGHAFGAVLSVQIDSFTQLGVTPPIDVTGPAIHSASGVLLHVNLSAVFGHADRQHCCAL